MSPNDNAARAVATDAFWGPVRRRHPDIDIVMLPPERPAAAVPADAAVEDPDGVARRRDAESSALWQRLVGDIGRGAEGPVIRWTSASAGAVRRESTTRVEGVDELSGLEVVERAAQTLRGDGWHVFVPPTGLARVMAGRDEAIGRTELQLVHDPVHQVLVMRIRSAAHVVGRDAVHVLVGGES